MASSFLSATGEAYFALQLRIKKLSESGETVEEVVPVDSKSTYKIKVFDSINSTLCTYDCKIIAFSFTNIPDLRGFVNADVKGNMDTDKFMTVTSIKIDASTKESSNIVTINISDIRDVERYSDDVFDNFTKITDFK